MSNPIHPDVRWGQTSTTPIDVDIAKTRRRIEEVLRKDTSDENIIKLAEELGIEVAHLPQQPEDYHNEPGRPNFGPGQVRHASDLKIGQMYFMMHLDGKKRLELRQKIQLIRLYCELATLHSKDVEEDVIEWCMEYTVVSNHGPSVTSVTVSLAGVHIHPYKSSFESHQSWISRTYLEFAEEQMCYCNVPYSGTQQK